MLTSPEDFDASARVVYINAAVSPPTIVVKEGETVRWRLINMTLRRSGVRLRLMHGDRELPWRVLAKDGASLPPEKVVTRASSQQVPIGETFDVEFTAEAPGELPLHVKEGPALGARVLGVQPIRVVPR